VLNLIVKIKLATALMMVFCVLGAGGCQSVGDGQRIRFVSCPEIKLGFTTKIFIESMDVSVNSAKKLINYADAKGFHWIELRDPEVVLTVEQCRQISDYAKSRKIEIGYAPQRDLLDEDFLEVYQRALPNAAVFKGPGTIRGWLGEKNCADPAKRGMSSAELEQVVAMANQTAQLARKHGIHLVIENSCEPLSGDGIAVFGLKDFFQRTGSEVGWLFDTGNFFAGARDNPTPTQVIDFLKHNGDNLFYLHVKSIQNGQELPALGDSILNFGTILPIISEYRVQYLVIELPSDKDDRQNYRNLDQSLDYLRKKSFIR
jgi:sugar phosphate isomerase/epimerase